MFIKFYGIVEKYFEYSIKCFQVNREGEFQALCQYLLDNSISYFLFLYTWIKWVYKMSVLNGIIII